MEKFLEWFLADDCVQFVTAIAIIMSIIALAFYMASSD